MGQTPGNSTGMSLLRSGLGGLSQGLKQYGRPNPQFNFSQMQQGLQQGIPKRPALGQGVTPNASTMNPFDPNAYMP